MQKYDVIIIGGGAAGLTAARECAMAGRRTAVLDMGDTPARKVAVSGGGRCNITNMAAARDRYFGDNPDFVRSALAAVRPDDILNWAARHHLELNEKAAGQYFCNQGAAAVVRALTNDIVNVKLYRNTPVHDVDKDGDVFIVRTPEGDMTADNLIVATGGISYANLGISDLGYQVAKKFGHKIIPPRPGLVALDTDAFPVELAGISIDVAIHIGRRNCVSDAMMFRHHGIGGPAAYRASLYDLGGGITIDMMPGGDALQLLRDAKKSTPRRGLANVLGQLFPSRLAAWLCNNETRNIADIRDIILVQIADKIHNFFIPADHIKRAAFTGAEVTFGGVSTTDISSKTMESKLCPGLFFAGEVLDITGDLGGFNLHWAWASGTVAGRNACGI